MASSKKTITPAQWNEALSAAAVDKDTMDRMVLEYLIVEGYTDVAEKFMEESGVTMDLDVNLGRKQTQVWHVCCGRFMHYFV